MYKQFIPYRNRLLAFSDVETLGKNVNKHAIVQFSCVHESQDQLIQKDPIDLYIMPTKRDLQEAEQKAIQISGFSLEKWEEKGAKPLKDCVDEIIECLHYNNKIIIGYNFALFDYLILQQNLSRINEKYANEISSRIIDLFSISLAFLAKTEIKTITQLNVFNYLFSKKKRIITYKDKKYDVYTNKRSEVKVHNALNDIMITREIYYEFFKRFANKKQIDLF